jgi:hypothetical protein
MTVNDYRKSCIRTVSVMNQLAIKIGANNPNHFSRIFDEVTGEDTQSSGLWRQNFSGKRPLSDKQLDRLLCIDAQVKKLYIEGPSKLWVAMWGDVSDLIEIIRDYNTNFSQMPFHFITKQVPYLIRDVADGGRVLGDLVWAISYYRYLKEMQPSVLVDIENYPVIQASCAWVLLESCINDSSVASELNVLGIRAQVTNELSAQELERMRKITFEQRLTDVGLIPKYVADFSMEEAEDCGAFIEDALSYEDAIDSAYDDVSFRQTILFSC